MRCSHCPTETVEFAVPPSLREYAPEAAAVATLCPQCLRVIAVDADGAVDVADTDFAAVGPFFPDGEGGVATALLVGLLDSLALNRREIKAVAAHAERHGVDLLLTLDRLATAAPDPYIDLERRLVQLHQVLD